MPLAQRAPIPAYSTPDWISPGECAQLTGLSTQSIYRSLRAGRFPFTAVKIGGQWRIRRAEVTTMTPAGTAALLDGEAQ